MWLCAGPSQRCKVYFPQNKWLPSYTEQAYNCFAFKAGSVIGCTKKLELPMSIRPLGWFVIVYRGVRHFFHYTKRVNKAFKLFGVVHQRLSWIFFWKMGAFWLQRHQWIQPYVPTKAAVAYPSNLKGISCNWTAHNFLGSRSGQSY